MTAKSQYCILLLIVYHAIVDFCVQPNYDFDDWT